MAGHGGVGWEIVVVGVVLGNYGAFLVKVARCFLLRGGRGGGQKVSGVTFSFGFCCVAWFGFGLSVTAPARCLLKIRRFLDSVAGLFLQ